MRGTIFAGLLSVACALPALAAVSEEDAARLGRDLTPTGAERAGNADGSIPASARAFLIPRIASSSA